MRQGRGRVSAREYITELYEKLIALHHTGHLQRGHMKLLY